jgi:hypothetical protein
MWTNIGPKRNTSAIRQWGKGNFFPSPTPKIVDVSLYTQTLVVLRLYHDEHIVSTQIRRDDTRRYTT